MIPETNRRKPPASGMANRSSRILLSIGRKKITRRPAPAAPKKDRKTDSARNCLMRSKRVEPKVFLIPISLRRVSDRAVERFIKLMQARSRMKKATAEKR